jgi:hypothetical protein
MQVCARFDEICLQSTVGMSEHLLDNDLKRSPGRLSVHALINVRPIGCSS